jgi:hypothetical protein
MVEGGRIDHGHHDGKPGYALLETVEFARADPRRLPEVTTPLSGNSTCPARRGATEISNSEPPSETSGRTSRACLPASICRLCSSSLSLRRSSTAPRSWRSLNSVAAREPAAS